METVRHSICQISQLSSGKGILNQEESDATFLQCFEILEVVCSEMHSHVLGHFGMYNSLIWANTKQMEPSQSHLILSTTWPSFP